MDTAATDGTDVETKAPSLLLILGIVIMPYFFVWFVMNKQYARTTRIVSLLWILFLASFILAGVSLGDDRSSGSIYENVPQPEPIDQALKRVARTRNLFMSDAEIADVVSMAGKIFRESGLNVVDTASAYVTLRVNPHDPQSHTDAMESYAAFVNGLLKPGSRNFARFMPTRPSIQDDTPTVRTAFTPETLATVWAAIDLEKNSKQQDLDTIAFNGDILLRNGDGTICVYLMASHHVGELRAAIDAWWRLSATQDLQFYLLERSLQDHLKQSGLVYNAISVKRPR